MGFSIPDFSKIQSIPGLIELLFDMSLWILGIVIFIQILRAGYKRFFAFGNPSKASESNQLISGAFIGGILLVSAVMILKTINPDLIKTSVNLSTFREAGLTLSGGVNLANPVLKAEINRLMRECNCSVNVTYEDIIVVNGKEVAVVTIQTHGTRTSFSKEGLIGYVTDLEYVKYFEALNDLGANEFKQDRFSYVLFSRVYHSDAPGFLSLSRDCRPSTPLFTRFNFVCNDAVADDLYSYLEIRLPLEGGSAVGESVKAEAVADSPVISSIETILIKEPYYIGLAPSVVGKLDGNLRETESNTLKKLALNCDCRFTIFDYRDNSVAASIKIRGFDGRLTKYIVENKGNIDINAYREQGGENIQYLRRTDPGVGESWVVTFYKKDG